MMAAIGHWLHFSYGDMMQMQTATFVAFAKEAERLGIDGAEAE